MQQEIERKFLVLNDDFMKDDGLHEKIDIKQGYISKDFGKIVRVRRSYYNYHSHCLGFLTIKVARPDHVGTDEYEYDIPEDEAEKLLLACDYPILEKTRYVIDHKDVVWEVDVFHGRKAGLIIAEVELKTADQVVEFPSWLGEEVTGRPEFYNANM